MKRTESIKEKDIISIINEEYSRAKKVMKPLLNGLNRSFVKFRWIKREVGIGGFCGYREIALNKKYRDSKQGNWSEENMRLTLRHEIVHLVERSHRPRFYMLLKAIGGHARVGLPVYEGKQKR